MVLLADVTHLDVKDEETSTASGPVSNCVAGSWSPHVARSQRRIVFHSTWARAIFTGSLKSPAVRGIDESSDIWDDIVASVQDQLTEVACRSPGTSVPAVLDLMAGLGHSVQQRRCRRRYRYLEWDSDDDSVFDDLSFSGLYGVKLDL